MGLFVLAISICVSVYSLYFKFYYDNVSDWEHKKRGFDAYPTLNAGKTFDLPRPEFDKTTPFVISAAIIALTVGFAAFTVIPAGHIGVQVTLGEVNQQTLSEGVHLVNPVSKIKDVEVRLTTYRINNASAGTKDLQQIQIGRAHV